VSAVLPELDEENWTSDDFVRDMPVDYTLLVDLDMFHILYVHVFWCMLALLE